MSTPATGLRGAMATTVDREQYRRLAGRVKVLSWVSLAYMTLEGAIAILAGVLAGSVALIGFGIDSAIEGFASAIIGRRSGMALSMASISSLGGCRRVVVCRACGWSRRSRCVVR